MAIREALNREISIRGLARSTIAVVVGIVLLISLRLVIHAVEKKAPSIVESTSSRVIGKWRGDNGTYIEIRSGGSFSTVNWPDWNGVSSASQDAEYDGTWEIQYEGPDSPEVVALSFKSTSGEIDLPAQLDTVRAESGSVELCVDVDPDNPCSFGSLKKTSNGR